MMARTPTWASVLVAAASMLTLPAQAKEVTDKPACATSLIGTPLSIPRYAPKVQKMLDDDIAIAAFALKTDPEREDHHIWYGRRLDYAGYICEAVDAFSAGIAKFPESYRLYRFRARDLTRARRFDEALADYEKALTLMGDRADHFEPDGLPNPLGLTISTYRGNIIYYHGQTSFATGDYETVVDGMAKSLAITADFARNDMRVPTAYWTYLALRKMGLHAEARTVVMAIEPDMKLIENDFYLRAVKIMQGRLQYQDVENTKDSTIKFAAAMERRFAGDEAGATAMLREIVLENPQGHWPSEVELSDPDRRKIRATTCC